MNCAATADELIDQLCDWTDEAVPEALLSELDAVREDATPRLLVALERLHDAVRRNTPLLDTRLDSLADFAMYKLAEWGEPEAFEPLLGLCRNDEVRLDEWLGDIIPIDMPWMLAATCHGRIDALKALATDTQAVGPVRWIALDALITLELHGQWSREAYLDWLVPQIKAVHADPHGAAEDWCGALVSAAIDLQLTELLPVLRDLCNSGKVDAALCDAKSLDEEFAARAAMSPEETEERFALHARAAERMDWLPRFGQEDEHAHHFGHDHDHEHEAIDPALVPETFVREQPKVGRNDPCPCGSGLKYKKCCLNA